MFETVVVATDGSRSVERAVESGLDIAERFDAAVHTLYVVDTGEIETSPPELREQFHAALERRGTEAIGEVVDRVDGEVTTAVREGDPPAEIVRYAESVDADVVVTGTRGRHGEGGLLLGSVAERVVRTCPVPVLTVRQFADEE